MLSNHLADLESMLQAGDKSKLSTVLRVHPAKITLAFRGLVKSQQFMARLQAEAMKLIEARGAQTV